MMMNRNCFVTVKLTMGTEMTIKKDSIIGISEVKVPEGTEPEVELILSNGKSYFISDTYSDFDRKFFAFGS